MSEALGKSACHVCVHKRDRESGGGSEDIGVLERLSPGGNTVGF